MQIYCRAIFEFSELNDNRYEALVYFYGVDSNWLAL